jgi:hypothetical protein
MSLTVKKKSIRSFVVVCLAVGAVLVAAGEARSGVAAGSHLYGKVTRAGRVSVRDAAGRRVTTIPAGSYVLTVRDMSKHQNFHLVAAKLSIDKRTGIRFVGAVRWTLTLGAGTYRAYSDRAPSGLAMFRVD